MALGGFRRNGVFHSAQAVGLICSNIVVSLRDRPLDTLSRYQPAPTVAVHRARLLNHIRNIWRHNTTHSGIRQTGSGLESGRYVPLDGAKGLSFGQLARVDRATSRRATSADARAVGRVVPARWSGRTCNLCVALFRAPRIVGSTTPLR